MNKAIILRYRDLVTPTGGTILEHQRIVNRHDNVWWGWWKRQTEESPIGIFREFTETIRNQQKPIAAFVFDAGSEKLYHTTMYRIIVAPFKGNITTIEPKRSPAYYQMGRYPAWFLFGSFKEITLTSCVMTYQSFPTNSDEDRKLTSTQKKGVRISSAKEMRGFDVTLYVVEIDNLSLLAT